MASWTAGAPGRPEGADRVVELLAARLLDELSGGAGAAITWLNHYSAQVAMRADVPLAEFDYLGVDGVLLCRLLGGNSSASRTSADLLLPELLARAAPLRIALVGSRPETLRLVADRIRRDHGHSVVLTRDGYAGLPAVDELRQELAEARAQLVIVGLGTPKQDYYALGLKGPGVLVATCGGWLDQFSGERPYYPSWAYPLRLNWLVRLAREPRRLWRRYTVDVVSAVRARADLVAYVAGQGSGPLEATVSDVVALRPPGSGTASAA